MCAIITSPTLQRTRRRAAPSHQQHHSNSGGLRERRGRRALRSRNQSDEWRRVYYYSTSWWLFNYRARWQPPGASSPQKTRHVFSGGLDKARQAHAGLRFAAGANRVEHRHFDAKSVHERPTATEDMPGAPDVMKMRPCKVNEAVNHQQS